MTKASKELIITGFLATALVLAVINALNRAKEQGPVKGNSGQRQAAESVRRPALSQLERQKERVKMKWGRDPFFEQGITEEEKVSGEPVGEELTLKGILWSERKPVALINMQAVNEGESVSGYVVVDIQKDKVILRKDGKDYEFKLER